MTRTAFLTSALLLISCSAPVEQARPVEVDPTPPVTEKRSVSHDPELWKTNQTPDLPPEILPMGPFPEEVKETWSYWSHTDEMTGKTTSIASVLSEETYELDFPYQGGTSAKLVVRNHPRHGTDVFVDITKGQLVCHSFSPCKVLVRFDESPPVAFRGAGPADSSSDTIFVLGTKKFVSSLKKSTTVKVALPFFQGGEKMFTFKVANLKWAF